MAHIEQQSRGSTDQVYTLARIDAQDESYVQPLREFLHDAGCSVSVNKDGMVPATYWLCVGDSEFVKAILARRYVSAVRRIVIVYDGDMPPQVADELKVKVILVDPVPLTSQLTKEIFQYFFTGHTRFYDARKGLGSAQNRSVISKQQSREAQPMRVQDHDVLDESRVSEIMKQIFASSKQSSVAKKRLVYHLRPLATRISLTIFVCIFLPVLLYIGATILSLTSIYGSGLALSRGNESLALTLVTYSAKYSESAAFLLQAGTPVFGLFHWQSAAHDQELLLGILMDGAKSERGVLRVLETGKLVVASLLSSEDTTGNVKGIADVLSLRSDVAIVSQHLALVQAQVNSLLASRRLPFSLSPVQHFVRDGLQKLVSLRLMMQYAERLLTLYPEAGGFRKTQTYLVLLQNSMELRPTGGFIGSILIMTFTDGKLANLDVQDVYTADGQLKGHIDPPLPLRQLLGLEHWYLRDSNWDPNFSVSGPQAAWFYEKEMGVKVDGVFAISLPLVTRLLDVTGPLELSDFNERISSSNFFVKSLLYTQTDFFPGSTQKKDFLGSLTNALLLRLTTDKDLSGGKLFNAISSSLDARDIQFYFINPDVEEIVSRWGWAGKAEFPECQQAVLHTACVQDGIGMIQANLGVNKANYFINQEALSHIVIHASGDIAHEVTVTIQNTSTHVGHDGGGDYRAYVRLLYPEDSNLVSVRVDGKEFPLRDMNQPSATSSSVTVDRFANVMSIGFSVVVPAHSEKQFMVSTLRHNAISLQGDTTYSYILHKQAGVSRLPWHVILEYPEVWRATSDVQLAKPGVLEYNTDLVRDGQMNVLFTKTL